MNLLCLKGNEAARRIGVGRTKRYELIASRDVKAVKLGKSTRILSASLHRLAGNAPYLVFEVELDPLRKARFVGPNGVVDREAQGVAPGRRLSDCKLVHQRRDNGIGHGFPIKSRCRRHPFGRPSKDAYGIDNSPGTEHSCI